MCGICGIINSHNMVVDRDVLNDMVDKLSHRGPDSKGIYTDKEVGLGHTRLKIIDLTKRAGQPMVNEDKTVYLVYNGEIYNYLELKQELIAGGHIFESETDAEIVLHAYEEWGFECLNRFNGMWAFAIWDSRKKTLFAARDRLGIKPFYYFFNGVNFVFASEIKAILEYPQIEKNANPQSIYEYLYLGYTLGDKAWIKEIHKLNPAHYLILSDGKLTIKRYWQAQMNPDYCLEETGASADIYNLICESVRSMLRADVEVSSHLSGGIDSSSISIIADKLSRQKIRTFSGMFEEGPEFDESRYIKEVVDKYNISNENIFIKPDDFIETVKKIVWHMDEPIAGPGAYPQYFISKLIHSRNVKVVLGGQGGDELFGGYPYYYSGISGSINRLESLHSDRRYKKYYTKKDLLLKFFPAHARKNISGFLSLRKRKLNSIFNGDLLKKIDFEAIKKNSGFYKGPFEDMQLWDINNYLPALLQVEDRLSMAFSVETRLPFLDNTLVEYALKLPFYFKINSFNFKYILRMAMKDILPEPVFRRADKKGFPTPVKIWLKEKKMQEAVSSEIRDSVSQIFIDKEISWQKLNIGLWLKAFKVSI